MYCMNCGKQLEDGSAFCIWCGVRQNQPPLLPMDTPMDAPPIFSPHLTKCKIDDSNIEKAKALLIDPTENIKSILCNNFLQTFISTGVLGNGFAILSDKRVYFKGKCLIRKGKGFYSKTEEKTVDLKDVTGTGYIHNSSRWARILGRILLIVSGACVGHLLLIAFACAATGQTMTDDFSDVMIALLIFLIPGLIGLFFLYWHRKTTYSVFEISYAGGGIAFDMGWITQQESRDFQQQLVLLKQKEKEQVAPSIFTKPEPLNSIPQQLKEYKELLDGGIITQDEFDTKKKELLKS